VHPEVGQDLNPALDAVSAMEKRGSVNERLIEESALR